MSARMRGDHEVYVLRYRLRLLYCWHGRRHRLIERTSNSWTAYCGKCFAKHTCIVDFGKRAD